MVQVSDHVIGPSNASQALRSFCKKPQGRVAWDTIKEIRFCCRKTLQGQLTEKQHYQRCSDIRRDGRVPRILTIDVKEGRPCKQKSKIELRLIWFRFSYGSYVKQLQLNPLGQVLSQQNSEEYGSSDPMFRSEGSPEDICSLRWGDHPINVLLAWGLWPGRPRTPYLASSRS